MDGDAEPWPPKELSEEQVVQLQSNLPSPAWLRKNLRPLKRTGQAYVLKSRRRSRASAIFGKGCRGYVVRASRSPTAGKQARKLEQKLPRAVLQGVSGECLVQGSQPLHNMPVAYGM
jgi:hypothetical protein